MMGGTRVWLHRLLGSFPHSNVILQHAYWCNIFNNLMKTMQLRTGKRTCWTSMRMLVHIPSFQKRPQINWVSEAPVLERKERDYGIPVAPKLDMMLKKKISLKTISQKTSLRSDWEGHTNPSFWPLYTQCTDIHVHICISLIHVQYSFSEPVVLESEPKLSFLKHGN